MKRKNIKKAMDMLIYNKYNPTKKQFTKEEHKNAEDINAHSIFVWNELKSKRYHTGKWYTKSEFTNAKGLTSHDLFLWNRWFPNLEQYSEKEINTLKKIHTAPEKITKEIFKNWKELIKFRFEVTSYDHLMRKLKSRSI